MLTCVASKNWQHRLANTIHLK